MTISANVRKELFEVNSAESKLIRIKPTEAKAGTTVYSSKQSQPLKMWTQEEHEKFLEAMEKFPAGPWKVIAAFIGTKTTRQTMTHAQKYRQKISRWRRGLRHKGRKHTGESSPVASGSDSEYSSKSNLMKAIDYVSGDEVPAQTTQNNGSQLFRLAELASIEVMKESSSPLHGNSPKQENTSGLANVGKQNSCSPEWQTTEVKLSPLRPSQSDKQHRELSAAFHQAATSCGIFSVEEAATAGAFRLPPLMMPQTNGLGIPPLRSKIDPMVLGRAQYASTN